ncbi:MAG: hypothetical protein AAGC46_15095 [Solirubrobacteraceae bacterium]
MALPLAAAALTLPSAAHAGVALSTSGLEWSDPSPQGYTLSDVEFSGNRGFAVGAGGTALKTDDGGATWSGLFTGTGLSVNSIDVIDGNTIALAVGDSASNCSLLISKDAGGTFASVPIGDSPANCSSSGFVSYDFVSGDVGYIMKSGGAVQKTADSGASFSAASTVDGGTALDFTDPNNGWAVGKNSVYRTTDGAQTWKPVFDAGGALTHIKVIDATHLIAWGKDRLVRSVDGGTTWTGGAIAGEPATVSFSDADHLAFIADAKLLLSSDGGATIRTVTIGNNDVRAVSYVSPNRLVAVGNGGVTYTSDNANADDGPGFGRQSSEPVGANVSSIAESAGGPIGFGAGKIGRVVNGQWVIRQTTSSSQVLSADFSSANNGFALFSGSLLRTVNNGVSWSRVEPGTPSAPSIVRTPSDSSTLLFGGFGIYRAGASGTFEQVDSKVTKKFKPAGARDLGSRVVTWSSAKKVLPLVSFDGGETFKQAKLPKGITRVDDLSLIPGKGLLLSSAGRLFRAAADSGKTWTEVTSLGDGLVDGDTVHAATATEWFAQGDSAWPFPVVYHSTDAGKSWQPQAVGANDTHVESLAVNGAKTAFALSTGSGPNTTGIFSTTVGGSRGAATTLSLKSTKASLKASGGKIQIQGSLGGGKGGETVHVALRKVGAGAWTSANVLVGANGGAFSASLKAKKGKYVVVAQWAGDSGRAGYGTKAQALTVK